MTTCVQLCTHLYTCLHTCAHSMETGAVSQIEHNFMFPLFNPPLPDYTRELEVRQKGKLYCFAVGPLVDDGATRTFFISCSEPLAVCLQMSHTEYMLHAVLCVARKCESY